MLDLNTIYNMDCLEGMKLLPSNSIDAIVTDPPYGLSFMGKKWDYDVPSKEIREEALRVLKPGGYLLAFAGTRTQHRMAVNIEDAGFEIRDMIAWVYGSGFPKSLNIGKAVDKLQGNEREVVGYAKSNPDLRDVGRISKENCGIDKLSFGQGQGAKRQQTQIDKGTSQWEGWGTALKPALEPITVARKPLSEKTVAENVLKWGTGGINIDGCRVEGNEELGRNNHTNPYGSDRTWSVSKTPPQNNVGNAPQGRFPANLIHDGSDEVVGLFPESSTTGKRVTPHKKSEAKNTPFTMGNPLAEYTDSGSASRFFYCAKASKSERNRGCEGLELKRRSGLAGADNDKEVLDDVSERFRTSPAQNNHPTVKPIALMEYLVKLVSKEGAVVIDPFAGSGSTLIACKKLGRQYIGFELDQGYCEIAENRLASN